MSDKLPALSEIVLHNVPSFKSILELARCPVLSRVTAGDCPSLDSRAVERLRAARPDVHVKLFPKLEVEHTYHGIFII